MERVITRRSIPNCRENGSSQVQDPHLTLIYVPTAPIQRWIGLPQAHAHTPAGSGPLLSVLLYKELCSVLFPGGELWTADTLDADVILALDDQPL